MRISKRKGESPGHRIGRSLAVVMLLGCVRVEAAPILRKDWPAADRPALKGWSRYLLAGPSTWAVIPHPPVTLAIRHSIWRSLRTDPGGADPMIRFLLWKQGLDPPRFAHYHPRLAPILIRLSRAPTVPEQLIPPPAPPAPIAPQPEVAPTPTTIPEPATLLLALGMAAWCVWRSRRHRALD